jgi:hypothetical protein
VGNYDASQPLFIDPTLAWNTFLGGSGGDKGTAIAVDGSGNVYLAGISDTTWGSPVRAYTGGSDAFAAKLNSSGVLQWNIFLGGSGGDYGSDIAVDGSGNAYVAGYSSATWGSPVRAFGGGAYDAFAAQLNSTSGALTWNTFLGGSVMDVGAGIAVDGSGNAYVAGYSNATWGSPVRAFGGGGVYDAFAAQLNSTSGALTWNTFLGESGEDLVYGIAVDGSGNVYVAGHSNATWGSPVRAFGGGGGSYDAFAAQLNSTSGVLQWNTFLGGSGSDFGSDIAVDGSGNAYVAGQSSATWGSPVRAFGGGASDAFVSTAEVAVPAPEINLKQGTTSVADGGSYDFGSKAIGTDTDIVFTIENTGNANLTLTTPLTLGGTNANQFSIQAQPTSPVAASGNTTFTVRFTPTSTGAKTATLSIANNDSDENPYDLTLQGTGTVGAASPATSTITAAPTSITANGSSTSLITVQLKDAFGNNLTTGGATVTLATTGGTLSNVTDNGNGTYTATLTSPTVTGTATITGKLGGVDLVDTETVTLAPGPASAATSTITAAPTTITADGTSTSVLTVQLKDAFGNNLTAGGATVTLATTAGTLGNVTDNGNGTYTATLTSAAAPGTATITGKLGGDDIVDTETVTFKVGVASAATSTITAAPTSITADGTSTSTITVQLKDALGNNLTTGGATVTLATTAGTLSNVTDNGNGTYTATLTSATVTGTATITGKLDGDDIVDTETVTLAPGAASPATSTITAAPTTITADGTSTSVLTVQLKDAFGNNLTTGGATVTLATTLGTLSEVTDNGDGTYTATLTSPTTTGTATITGKLGEADLVDTEQVTFAPGAASLDTSTITANPTSIPVGGTSTSIITVQLKDAFGNNLTTGGATVTLSTTAGTLSNVTDNGDGTYTATLTSPTVPGTATVSGKLGGQPLVDTAEVTVLADTTPPTWANTYPKAGPVTDTTAQVLVKSNEDGKAYFVCLPKGSLAPTAAQVKAGQDASGNPLPANRKGAVDLTADTEAGLTATGLTPETEYDFYVVGEDLVPNLQEAPAKVPVKTLADTTPPTWADTYPKAGPVTDTTAEVLVKSNEDGKAYFVCVPKGSPKPTAAQVKAGVDGNGDPLPTGRSGSVALTADTEAELTATGLAPDTEYDFYVVGEDEVPNLQAEAAQVPVKTLTGADVTPPAWAEDYPKPGPVTDTTAQVLVKSNEKGKAYFVCVPKGSPKPTAAQVKAGLDANGNPLPANRKGSADLEADTEAGLEATGLSPDTEYDFYVVAEDEVPNLQAEPTKVAVKTQPDTSAPEWVEPYPKVGTLTDTTAEVLVKSNESGKAYFVCVPKGAPTPTPAQAKAGLDASGNPLPAGQKGSVLLLAGTEASLLATGLGVRDRVRLLRGRRGQRAEPASGAREDNADHRRGPGWRSRRHGGRRSEWRRRQRRWHSRPAPGQRGLFAQCEDRELRDV